MGIKALGNSSGFEVVRISYSSFELIFIVFNVIT